MEIKSFQSKGGHKSTLVISGQARSGSKVDKTKIELKMSNIINIIMELNYVLLWYSENVLEVPFQKIGLFRTSALLV